jgi:creatinine amidohydrolase/Fe(II)-dependent formamide hydrolase-like protein
VRSRPENAGYPLRGGPGSRRTAFARTPRPAEEAPDGVYGDPRRADAALGEFVIETAAAALADHCRELTEGGRP